MKKRFLSMLLVITMLFSILPFGAFATELDLPNAEVVQNETHQNTETDEHPGIALIHTMIQKYLQEDLTLSGSNLAWIVADLAAYETLYPESEYHLTEAEEQACLDQLIADVCENETASVLARTIIALRTMGYDAKTVFTQSREEKNFIAQLTSLVIAEDTSVVSVYTLPYVMIALRDEMNAKTEGALIDFVITQKDVWMDTTYGTDALSPMLIALAPYYDDNDDVRAVVEQALTVLQSTQREDGLLSSFPGGESATTALGITGLSALGIDAQTIKNGEKNLLDGLMSDINDTEDGFSNEFATEQGLRALLAWHLLLDANGRGIYDFPPTEKVAKATWASACPVTFETIPTDATVAVTGVEAVSGNSFDLAEGTYCYIVSKEGYETNSGEITITTDEAEQHIAKNLKISLVEEVQTGGGISDEINVTIRVMVHDKDECQNQFTYKNNASDYTSLVSETLAVRKGTSVFAVLDQALGMNDIPYVESNPGYISSINGLGEFDHGDKSGWMFTVNGQHQTSGCRETFLNSSATVVWFYTDDYTNEKGSSGFSSGGSSITEEEPEKEPEKEEPEVFVPNFSDVSEADWYYDAVCYVCKNGLFEGTATGFAPNHTMTRAMLVTVLHRMSGAPAGAAEDLYADVTDPQAWYYDAVCWATEKGIVSGYGEETFAPNDSITREQIATILYRYAKEMGVAAETEQVSLEFADAAEVSDFAKEAVAWAYETKLLQGMENGYVAPKAQATRAQVATLLMRFSKMIQQ